MYGIEEGDSLVTFSKKVVDSPIWRPEDLKSEALVPHTRAGSGKGDRGKGPEESRIQEGLPCNGGG